MRITIVIFCLFFSVAAGAQKQVQNSMSKEEQVAKHKEVQYSMSKEELVAKRKELQDDIAETERRLELIKSDKKATLSQLRDLQNKLALRQNLIANINDEINDIDNTIKKSSKEVDNLKQKLAQLRVRYAQSIRYAYETRSSYDMLAFLFSSKDFNDAVRRMKYLKKFRDFRKQQVDQIKATQNQLQHKIGVLTDVKQQKDKLLNTEVEQKKVLVEETDHTNQVMQELKGRESELMKNIEKNRVIARRVDKAINTLIEREIAKAAKQAEEEEKRRAAELAKANPPEQPVKPATTEHPENNPPAVVPRPKQPKAETQPLLLTPTDIALANNFEGNMGKLYWPVEKGFISDHFGTHPHPVETRVMIENTGIDIRTTAGANVKAVFEGIVTSVSSIEGNMIVLIKHGNFFTVYNNLKSASVRKDEHVSTNQQIGTVANNDEGEPTLKFQIWKVGKKGPIKLNPESWLGKAH